MFFIILFLKPDQGVNPKDLLNNDFLFFKSVFWGVFWWYLWGVFGGLLEVCLWYFGRFLGGRNK